MYSALPGSQPVSLASASSAPDQPRGAQHAPATKHQTHLHGRGVSGRIGERRTSALCLQISREGFRDWHGRAVLGHRHQGTEALFSCGRPGPMSDSDWTWRGGA